MSNGVQYREWGVTASATGEEDERQQTMTGKQGKERFKRGDA